MSNKIKKATDLSLATSGFIVDRTAKRMKQFYQQMLKQHDLGITVDQWVILQALDKEDGLSQFELGQRCYKDAPTLTRIIDLLCGKNLLRRGNDPVDRRKFKICLTTAGAAKIKAVKPVLRQFRAQCWKGLAEEDLKRLTEIMNTIFNNIKTD